MERDFLGVKLVLNCARPAEGHQVGGGAEGGERLGHEGGFRVPASILARRAADNLEHVVPASALGSGDSMPGAAGDGGHTRSD